MATLLRALGRQLNPRLEAEPAERRERLKLSKCAASLLSHEATAPYKYDALKEE
jgi:hypothetical protein